MQFIKCPNCGFANEIVDTFCARCSTDISRVPPVDAEAQAALQGGVTHDQTSAVKQWWVTGEEYPFARRFAGFLRFFAKVFFYGNLFLLAIFEVAMLMAGPDLFKNMGAGTGEVVVYIWIALFVGVLWYLWAWFIYICLMALPDLILCHLTIERNTRR